MRPLLTIFAMVVLSLRVAGAGDGDWSRFRGPNGVGVSDSQAFPSSWDEKNVHWKVAPLGPGVSSPSVWGSQFVLTSSNEDGTVRRVECRRVSDGGLDWEQSFAFDTNPKHGKNSYATPTAACDADGIYAVLSSATRFVVLALDWSGSIRWQTDLGPYESKHGYGASPVLLGDRVFVAKESDGPSEVVALNRADGAIAWRVKRDGELAAYATPVFHRFGDATEILVSSTAGLSGLDPQSGSTLWHEACFPDRCVGSIALGGEFAVASCGGGGKGTRLVGLWLGPEDGKPRSAKNDAGGGTNGSRLVWEQTRTIPYCPTPIIVGEHVFVVTDQGIARCLKLATGDEVWTERMLSNTSASPIGVGGRIVVLSEDGNSVVFAAEPEARILARNVLEDEFLSTPAMVGDRMLARGKSFVWCIGPAQ